MQFKNRVTVFSFISIAVLFFSCYGGRLIKTGVEQAMQQYDHFIQKMDADSIAWLYAPDGDLGNVAHGRDSIRNFLLTFKKLKMLSQSSVSSSVKINGNEVVQKGTYRQVVVIPSNDTLKLKGKYTAKWVWMEKAWHIRRMDTTPIE